MAKKKSAGKPKAEAKVETPTQAPPSAGHHIAPGGLPKFNFNAPPTTTGGEQRMTDTPLRPSYDDVQREAKGPGSEEWRQADKARADLTATYQSLKDDERYAPEYRAERAWAKYEETRAKVEQLAPEAREKMLRSAEGLERMSIPTPEGEGLITKDTNKLLLTAHERSRIEGLLSRAKEVGGPSGFAEKPHDILSREYERGLKEGGPGGGATVRAVYGLARDWGLDIDTIVDAHRKPHHHGALEDAQQRRIQAEMIGRHVPESPFKRGGSPKATGTYGSDAKAFMPQRRGMVLPPKTRRAPWK